MQLFHGVYVYTLSGKKNVERMSEGAPGKRRFQGSIYKFEQTPENSSDEDDTYEQHEAKRLREDGISRIVNGMSDTEDDESSSGAAVAETSEITFPEWLQDILHKVEDELNENDMTRLFFCTKNGTNFCKESKKELTDFKFIVRDNKSFHITYEVNETDKEKKADLSFTLKFEIGDDEEDDEESNKKIVWISRLNDPTWSKLSIMIQKKNDSSKTILLVPKGKADMIPTEKTIWQWFQRHFQGGQREVISTNTKKTQKTYGLDIIVPVFTTQNRAILEVKEIKVAAKENIPKWFEGTGSYTLKKEAVKGVDKERVQKLYNKNFKFDYTHDFTEAEKQGGGQKFKSVPALCLPAFGAPLPNFTDFENSTEAQVLKKANFNWKKSLAQVFQLVPETLLAGTEDEYTREWAQTCFALLNNQLDFSLSLDSYTPRANTPPLQDSLNEESSDRLPALDLRSYQRFTGSPATPGYNSSQAEQNHRLLTLPSFVQQSGKTPGPFPGTLDLQTPHSAGNGSPTDKWDGFTLVRGDDDDSSEDDLPQSGLLPVTQAVQTPHNSPGNVPSQLLQFGETPLDVINLNRRESGNSPLEFPKTPLLSRAVNTEHFVDVLSRNQTPAADVLERLGEGPQARFVDRCLNFY